MFKNEGIKLKPMNGEPTLFDQPKETVNVSMANKIENYHTKIKPTLTNREREVYDAVKVIQPCTMHQVADHIKRNLNTISGRFSSLVKKEYLAIKERKNNKSVFIINKNWN